MSLDNLCTSEALERFAEIEHQQWMAWAKSLMEREELSHSRIIRWNGLMIPYSQLNEEQKDQDRKWARLVLIEAQKIVGIISSSRIKGVDEE
jgi:hypothetical protein